MISKLENPAPGRYSISPDGALSSSDFGAAAFGAWWCGWETAGLLAGAAAGAGAVEAAAAPGGPPPASTAAAGAGGAPIAVSEIDIGSSLAMICSYFSYPGFSRRMRNELTP